MTHTQKSICVGINAGSLHGAAIFAHLGAYSSAPGCQLRPIRPMRSWLSTSEALRSCSAVPRWPPHHSQPNDVALACEEKNSATVAMLAARAQYLRCCWQRPAPIGRPASPSLGTRNWARVACGAAGKPAAGSSKPAGAPKASGAPKAAKPAAAAAKQPAKQATAAPAAAQDDKSGLCLIVGLGNPGKERGIATAVLKIRRLEEAVQWQPASYTKCSFAPAERLG